MKNLTYIFAATLFMVACNNEEISSLQDGKNLEVKFTSNLTDYDSQVVSRLSGTSFDQGDEVAIWASSEGTAPFTGKKVLTAGENGQLSSKETFKYQGDNEVSFSALYPASLCAEDSKPESITLNVEEYENGFQTLQDLLYATGKGSAKKPTVALSFSHKGVKIDVAVKQGKNIDLTGAEVYVKAKSGGVFSFANSSITPTGAEATDIKIPFAVVTDFTNNVNYESTIVAPQTLEGECIGIKLQSETETKYLTYSKIELKEGFRYCFHIDTRKNDVGKTEILIVDNKVSEEPWISDAPTAGEVEVGEVQNINKCLKLTGCGVDDEGKEVQTQAFYQISGTFPSGTYTFSCKVKSSTEIKSGNLIFQPSSWTGNQTQDFGVFQFSQDWSDFSYDITIPSEQNNLYTRFFIQFNANPEDYILIDDVSLTRDGDSKNYIENSDFEAGNTQGWDSYGNNVSLGEY